MGIPAILVLGVFIGFVLGLSIKVIIKNRSN